MAGTGCLPPATEPTSSVVLDDAAQAAVQSQAARVPVACKAKFPELIQESAYL
jgi:hypothetical protein